MDLVNKDDKRSKLLNNISAVGRQISKQFKPVVQFFKKVVGTSADQNTDEPRQDEQQVSTSSDTLSNSQAEETDPADRTMLIKDACLAMAEIRHEEDYGDVRAANRAQNRLDKISEKLGISHLMRIRDSSLDEEEDDNVPAPPPPTRESTYCEDGPVLKKQRRQ